MIFLLVYDAYQYLNNVFKYAITLLEIININIKTPSYLSFFINSLMNYAISIINIIRYKYLPLIRVPLLIQLTKLWTNIHQKK